MKFILILILIFLFFFLIRKESFGNSVKPMILIITAEDRDYDFINLHNQNLKKYSKLHGYTYKSL